MTQSHEVPQIEVMRDLGVGLMQAMRANKTPRRSTGPYLATLVAALLIVVLIFTPPGRALAQHLGELIGIGAEPSRSQQVPPGGGDVAYGASEDGAEVIGIGVAPGDLPFQIVAFQQHAPASHTKTATLACVGVDFPEGGEPLGSCLPSGNADAVVDPYMFGVPEEVPIGSETQFIVEGPTAPLVAEIEVTYRDTEGRIISADSALAHVPQPLAAQIGAEPGTGFFVAFIPKLVAEVASLDEAQAQQLLADVMITGKDEQGAILWRENLGDSPESDQGLGLLLRDPPKNDTVPTGPAVPIGSGINVTASSYRGIPNPPNQIGIGSPTSAEVDMCRAQADGSVAATEKRADPTLDPLFCEIAVARSKGLLEPGPYTNRELRSALQAAGVR